MGPIRFPPQPRDIVHFDVLVPLLAELRSWPGTVVLVTVKATLAVNKKNERTHWRTWVHCRKRSKYSLAHPNTELSGYVHARPGGIESDQSNFTTFSLEIALQTRVSLNRSLQSIFSEPWQNETRNSCGFSSAEKRAGSFPGSLLN